MPVSPKTSKVIWGQCAARCCLCRKDVIHEGSGDVTSLIGEVAHIVGERENAARGASPLSVAERNEHENLLLLCRDDHKIVDDDPKTYAVEALDQIKSDHIAWVANRLGKVKPWQSNLSHLVYINVPRLCEQMEMRGHRVDLSKYSQNQSLHSLAWELNQVMSEFQNVLSHVPIDAVPVESLALHEGHNGATISFDKKVFRTKNIAVDPQAPTSHQRIFYGDLKKDPHIYIKLGDFRLVLFVDEKWITTSTAFTLFRPSSGQSTFSGLGRITSIDYDSGIMTATPWVVGVPESDLARALRGKSSDTSTPSISLDHLDALVDLDRGKVERIYYSGAPDVCDLCRKIFENEKYMIDGAMKESGVWANMCAACFANRGEAIRCGKGQLYIRDDEGWLCVAGF